MPSPPSTPPAAPLTYGRPRNRAWVRVLVVACLLSVLAGGIVRLARPIAAERYRKWREHRATLAAMAKERDRATAFQKEFLRQQSEGMTFARPRVDITSSCVAMNVGHMMPLCLRHPPQPLHCSRFPANDRSLNANASTG